MKGASGELRRRHEDWEQQTQDGTGAAGGRKSRAASAQGRARAAQRGMGCQRAKEEKAVQAERPGPQAPAALVCRV